MTLTMTTTDSKMTMATALRVLGAVQVVWSIVGMGSVIATLVRAIRAGGVSTSLGPQTALGILAFALVGWAGIALLRSDPVGIRLSRVAQGLQVISIQTFGVAYTFSAQPSLSLKLGGDWMPSVSLAPGIWAGPGLAAVAPYLAVDVIALALFVVLRRMRVPARGAAQTAAPAT